MGAHYDHVNGLPPRIANDLDKRVSFACCSNDAMPGDPVGVEQFCQVFGNLLLELLCFTMGLWKWYSRNIRAARVLLENMQKMKFRIQGGCAPIKSPRAMHIHLPTNSRWQRDTLAG